MSRIFLCQIWLRSIIFSESYISRKIKKETGYTFVDILNGIRLMCAASLLKTGRKISDVCRKTDLMTSYYFYTN